MTSNQKLLFLTLLVGLKYGSTDVVNEWGCSKVHLPSWPPPPLRAGYSLVDACERFVEDNDCELFLNILRGEVSEEVYDKQMAHIDEVVEIARKVDVAKNKKAKGVISRKVGLHGLLNIYGKEKN
jgi:hypothetical protein